jgi:tRNA pseudouridine32 synthase/23S rRNA pseudouridine746 synthase
MNSVELVYLDDDLLVLNKPAGLLSVPGKGPEKQDCLSARVQSEWPGALVVHRLDQATSGLIVMARSIEVQRALSHAFASRQVSKTYVAIVHGKPHATGQEWNTIDLPIAADWARRPLRVIDPILGKASLTHWRLAEQSGGSQKSNESRIILEPHTGRTHQLRVHLQAIGHPIVGDRLYGASGQVESGARLMLHAFELKLTHPCSHDELMFESPPPF